MLRVQPPFRAHHVGSLLRPATVKEARAAYAAGTIDAAALRATEDKAILDLIRHQEGVGLQSITDGEVRRTFWHYDFLIGPDCVQMQFGAWLQFYRDRECHSQDACRNRETKLARPSND